MTKEYISRDEMIEQTKARIVLGAPKFNTGLETAIEVATSIPAADVMEVKHGKWVRVPYDKASGGPRLRCSVCRSRSLYAFNFCPDCGAMMDGGQDE